MAYERYGRNVAQGSTYGWDREDYGQSSAREYRSAGELGGYGRDNQRDYRQQRDSSQGDYGQRDFGRQDYGPLDYGHGRYAQNERLNRGGDYGGGWGDRDRERFTGGGDYYRGDQDRQSYDGRQGRDTYRQSRGTFDRQPQNHDRGFLERAGDEVRSWFGDEDAERRRERDARENERSGGYGRDEHYHSWRKQQIAAFDRDYDEYRQENQSKFHNEFASWRTERQSQRDLLNKVSEHMEVVGSDGEHVGTVDKVQGDRILLTKSDADAGGRHHSIPSRWLQSVEDGKLRLRKTAEEAKQHWRDEERQSAMFAGDRPQSNEGDWNRSNESGASAQGTNLNRSFSGTY